MPEVAKTEGGDRQREAFTQAEKLMGAGREVLVFKAHYQNRTF